MLCTAWKDPLHFFGWLAVSVSFDCSFCVSCYMAVNSSFNSDLLDLLSGFVDGKYMSDILNWIILSTDDGDGTLYGWPENLKGFTSNTESLQNEHLFRIKFSTIPSHGGVEKELQIVNLYENSTLNQNPPRSALQHLRLGWVMVA